MFENCFSGIPGAWIHIPRQTDTPELSSFQGEFLKAAGMEPEDYRIEAFLWDGAMETREVMDVMNIQLL